MQTFGSSIINVYKLQTDLENDVTAYCCQPKVVKEFVKAYYLASNNAWRSACNYLNLTSSIFDALVCYQKQDIIFCEEDKKGNLHRLKVFQHDMCQQTPIILLYKPVGVQGSYNCFALHQDLQAEEKRSKPIAITTHNVTTNKSDSTIELSTLKERLASLQQSPSIKQKSYNQEAQASISNNTNSLFKSSKSQTHEFVPIQDDFELNTEIDDDIDSLELEMKEAEKAIKEMKAKIRETLSKNVYKINK